MPGKRVRFDDATWEAILAVSRSKDLTFEELADEAFADLLKKHKQPVPKGGARGERQEAPTKTVRCSLRRALFALRFCAAQQPSCGCHGFLESIHLRGYVT
jgi:hypothetical protein